MESKTPKRPGCLKIGLISFVALTAIVYVLGLILPDATTAPVATTRFSSADSIAIAKMDSTRAATAVQDSITKANNAAKAKKLLNGLKADRDDFEKVTFYYGGKKPYINTNQLYLYLAVGDDPKFLPGLRMKIQYAGNDWIFWDEAEVLVDETKIALIGMGRTERDNNGGKVWETTDSSISAGNLSAISNLIAIRAIADSKKAVIRLSGKRTSDRTITRSEKTAMKKILAAYDALTN